MFSGRLFVGTQQMLPIEIENKREEIRAVVERCGAFLVDISFRRAGNRVFLTVLADKKGGITLDECAGINRSLGAAFDEWACAALEGGYHLEVNSPGLDRPMRTPEDFLRAVGENVRVIFRESPTRTLTLSGEILSVTDTSVTLRKSKENTLRELPVDSIVKAVREIKF